MTRKTSLASLRNTISKILLKACPGTPTRNTVFFHITQCCPPPILFSSPSSLFVCLLFEVFYWNLLILLACCSIHHFNCMLLLAQQFGFSSHFNTCLFTLQWILTDVGTSDIDRGNGEKWSLTCCLVANVQPNLDQQHVTVWKEKKAACHSLKKKNEIWVASWFVGHDFCEWQHWRKKKSNQRLTRNPRLQDWRNASSRQMA